MTAAHKDVCMFEVVPPVWPNSTLTANVPHVQFEASWLDTFDVETLSNISPVISSNSAAVNGRMHTHGEWCQSINWKMICFAQAKLSVPASYVTIPVSTGQSILPNNMWLYTCTD